MPPEKIIRKISKNATMYKKIIRKIDWDCEVSILSHDENVGHKIGTIAAIDWFFSQVNEGIILEDDCVPDHTFFAFCQELLEYYRDDKRIFMISGDNFQHGRKRTGYSYYFSRFTPVWGWATWKRSWEKYDPYMRLWPQIRQGEWLVDILHDKKTVKHWKRVFDLTYANSDTIWDWQLMFACWMEGASAVLPCDNLVSNIGFGEDAVHLNVKESHVKDLATVPMRVPLQHPPFIIRDFQADQFVQMTCDPPKSELIEWKENILGGKTIMQAVFRKK